MMKQILTAITLFVIAGCTTVTSHQDNASLAKTSVSITLENKRSGGSGVILRSTPGGTTILTNKHVCGLIQNGGIVNSDDGQTYPIAAFRVYTRHDLCTVFIVTDLHVNTAVAPRAPELYDSLAIAGHPALLPTIISRGHFSKQSLIEMMVDAADCDGSESDPADQFTCIFMGKKAIIQSFQAQATSALIMPGSSGSGVFNSKGELSGLVFAGPGDGLGYGFIVPFAYVKDFLSHQADYPEQVPNKAAKTRNLFITPTALEQSCRSNKNICRIRIFSGLWTE